MILCNFLISLYAFIYYASGNTAMFAVEQHNWAISTEFFNLQKLFNKETETD